MGFRVQGSGFRIWCLGVGVEGTADADAELLLEVGVEVERHLDSHLPRKNEQHFFVCAYLSSGTNPKL